MSLFHLHSITAWNDYFSVNGPTNFESQTYSSRQNPSNSYVYFSNCLFISITSGNHGGSLSCSSSVTHFLVESSSFISCKTSGGYGGAIYFENSGGQSVLYNVCGYDCCSTYSSGPHYQFAYLYVKDDATSKNYINYSSITRCVNEISNSHHMLYLFYGKICCPSINSSMNKCKYHSGIYCDSYADSNLVTGLLSYSTFADNNAFGHGCIILWNSAKYEMKSCNVLRNTQGNLGDHGTFQISGNVLIEDSCVLENNANTIFYVYSSFTLTLSNCTVDKTTVNGGLIIQKTIAKSFIHALKHVSNLICHAKYDSVGTLTPIIQTPSPSKKQRPYCSCGILFQLPQLREVTLLFNILIFNSIHSDASFDPWH
jgi:hypothetical protein